MADIPAHRFSLLWLVLLFTIFYIGGCRIGRSPFYALRRSGSVAQGLFHWGLRAALACRCRGFGGGVAWLLHPSGCCHGNGWNWAWGGDIKFCGILGLIYGPSGMALVFFVAAVFAMPMVLLFRRLSRPRQPIAIPFLPFLACGCSIATLAELFYDRRMCL